MNVSSIDIRSFCTIPGCTKRASDLIITRVPLLPICLACNRHALQVIAVIASATNIQDAIERLMAANLMLQPYYV